MEMYKLKIKIGPHEFEAEGPTEVVQEQFRAFKELASAAPLAASSGTHANAEELKPARSADEIDGLLSEIMNVEDRVVSLLAKPEGVHDALLLLLYGQKVLRENNAVSGAEILAGVKATGGLAVTRVDKLLEGAAKVGDVIVRGERRGKRYRLTNAGLAKARSLADGLVSLVV